MEVWKDIPGYEGLYEASSQGRLRTKEGKTTTSARFEKRVWKQRVLKQKYKRGKNGRQDAMITLWKDGIPHYHIVARLIATTFHENLISTDMTVNHKDGNTLNNNESNLEWLTHRDNIIYGMNHQQYASMMNRIVVKDGHNNIIEKRSYAEMDRFLNRYVGYTSRMMILGRRILSNRSGQEYYVIKESE